VEGPAEVTINGRNFLTVDVFFILVAEGLSGVCSKQAGGEQVQHMNTK
jgi:hypothetical protein